MNLQDELQNLRLRVEQILRTQTSIPAHIGELPPCTQGDELCDALMKVIPIPIIRKDKIYDLEKNSVRGQYAGPPPKIYLQNSLRSTVLLDVLLHEYTHYMHKHNAYVPIHRCELEAQASTYLILRHYNIDCLEYSAFYLREFGILHDPLTDFNRSTRAIINVVETIISQLEVNANILIATWL